MLWSALLSKKNRQLIELPIFKLILTIQMTGLVIRQSQGNSFGKQKLALANRPFCF